MKQARKHITRTSNDEDRTSYFNDRTINPALRCETGMKIAEEALDKGNYADAIDFALWGYNIAVSEFPADDDRIPEALQLAARGFMHVDNPGVALQHLEEVRTHREKHLSNDDPRLGDTYALIGTIAGMGSSLSAGERLLKKALSIKEKHYGPDSSKLCLELEGLANIAYKREKYRAARKYFERLLAIQTANCESAVGDVARSNASMAAILVHMEKNNEAVPFAEKAIEMYEKMGSPKSTDHIVALQNLAYLKKEKEMYADAATLFSQAAALTMSKMFSDDDQDAKLHYDYMVSMAGESQCLLALKDYTKAERHARSLVLTCEEYDKYLSPYLSVSIMNLAHIHIQMEMYDEAENEMLRVLKYYKDAKDRDNMADTYKSLADLYTEMGDNTKAIKIKRRAERLQS